MSKSKTNVHSRFYQNAVSFLGTILWLYAFAFVAMQYGWKQQFAVMALVPLMILISLFPNTFKLPSGLAFTRERVTLSFADSIVLLVAYWFGFAPAVFLAGIEGFFSTRRTSKFRTSFFSSSMMMFGALAASLTISVALRLIKHAPALMQNRALAVAIAILAASIAQMFFNVALLSILFSLRGSKTLIENLREKFSMAASLLLPTGTIANLLCFAFQYNLLLLIILAAPIFAAVYFGYRQYRTSVEQRMAIMEKAHRETIEALAVAINAKDEVTHEHVLRVQIYAMGVARLLGCSEEEIEALRAGALLHDIGKIAVPDHILNKPGKLTAAEFEQMKMHTLAGAQILSRVEFPYPIVPIVRSHHERWDGGGYPDGLRGEEIPLTARILSVVDCYDAVREDRQYRKGLTREQAIDLIMQGSGTQYDPRVVGAFLANLPVFEAEIQAHRNKPVPTFGIETSEKLSFAARQVPPAAGLAEEQRTETSSPASQFTKDELAALYELTQKLNAVADAKEMLATFAAHLKKVVSYDLCALSLIEAESGECRVEFAEGEGAEVLRGRRIAFNEGVTGWVLANRQAFCNTDPKLDLPPAKYEACAAQFSIYRTLAVFPILRDKELYGALALYSAKQSEYEARQQDLIKETTTIIAGALSKVVKSAAKHTGALPTLEHMLEPKESLESTLTH
jgi:putative nucleotidyltransferase with HDIG domain